MELRYLTAMEEHGLKQADLPKDAKTGIKQINQIQKAMKMLEKTGKTVKEETLEKVRALDKWVYFEILDHVHETDNNPDEKPVEAKEVIEEMKENADEKKDGEGDESKPKADTIGDKINTELAALHSEGKSEWSIDEIKQKAPNSYNAIFDSYEDGEDKENGVATQYYSLIESGDETYTLKQL